jgi:hypothetical protein
MFVCERTREKGTKISWINSITAHQKTNVLRIGCVSMNKVNIGNDHKYLNTCAGTHINTKIIPLYV